MSVSPSCNQVEQCLEQLADLSADPSAKQHAPALVVKLGKAVDREEFFVEQVGHQNALLAAG